MEGLTIDREPRLLSDWRSRHPVLTMVAGRTLLGLLTLFVVSIVIFLATQALPGNAANAILGRDASPERLQALEEQLHLDKPIVSQYLEWIGGILHGDFGTSLVNGESVSSLIGPRLVDSAVLVIGGALVGTAIGGVLGVLSAARRDTRFDHVASVIALAITAIPEFVLAMTLVILLSVNVFQVLPAVSTIPPGTTPLDNPEMLILPIATLALVVAPYMYRMTRGAMIEALESDYVEMADLKGLSRRRVLLIHALPNALPPIVQVIGLNLLYLAGGIVVVEYVFNFPGIGAGLVDAVSNRDVPVVQFTVLLLAAFYVFVNITVDAIALLASPRRRAAR